jgi:hypothetical protein
MTQFNRNGVKVATPATQARAAQVCVANVRPSTTLEVASMNVKLREMWLRGQDLDEGRRRGEWAGWGLPAEEVLSEKKGCNRQRREVRK